MDADGSGTVDASELKQIMTALGHGLTSEEADNMIAYADKDMSGEVDFQEFSHVVLTSQ